MSFELLLGHAWPIVGKFEDFSITYRPGQAKVDLFRESKVYFSLPRSVGEVIINKKSIFGTKGGDAEKAPYLTIKETITIIPDRLVKTRTKPPYQKSIFKSTC